MKYYSCDCVKNLIDRYIAKGGEMLQMREGSLGYGDLLLYDFSGNLKTFVIHEKFQSCWSSVHTIRGYNKMPKKYKDIIEKAENSECEDE